MMGKKKCFVTNSGLGAVLVLAIVGLLFVYVWGNFGGDEQVAREENLIGISEEAMRKENQTYEQDGRKTQGNIGDSMAVFLQYRKDLTDLDADIYVKHENNGDWFFCCNISGNGALDYVQQLEREDSDEYVLLYFGTGSISYIEVDKGDGSTWVINPEMGMPFAYVMKCNWNVAVYDIDGSIITPHQSKI